MTSSNQMSMSTTPNISNTPTFTSTTDFLGLLVSHKENFAAGGAAICCLCLAVVVAVLCWRRRRLLRLADSTRQLSVDRGDGVYIEISEALAQTGHQKKKKKRKNTKQEKRKGQNNNDPATTMELQPLGIDAAPDIIHSHVGESIYETLDGRRAALCGADPSPLGGDLRFAQRRMHDVKASVYRLPPLHGADPEAIYDHLNRYGRRPTPWTKQSAEDSLTLHQLYLSKRATDPEVERRQTSSDKPRKAHSADAAADLKACLQGVSLPTTDMNITDDAKQATSNDLPEHPCRHERDIDQIEAVDELRTVDPCVTFSSVLSSLASTPTRKRKGSTMGSLGSFESATSLAELAKQSCAGGRRLVCQLTMVGVLEEGKCVVPKPGPGPVNNAFFIIEPARDSDIDDAGDGDVMTPSGRAMFRIVGELPSEPDSGAAAGKGSEYFTLEPLAAQGEESSPQCKEDVDKEIPPSLLSNFYPGKELKRSRNKIRSSFGGHDSSTILKDCTANSDSRSRSQSFRVRRISSCPTPSPPPEEDEEEEEGGGAALGQDFSPPLLPRNRRYRRSFSSPDRNRQDDEPRPQKKMDAETLKARIQQEMRALGFIDDAAPGASSSAPLASNEQHHFDRGSRYDSKISVPAARVKQPRNEYFILEPDADSTRRRDAGDEDGSAGAVMSPRAPSQGLTEISPPLPPRPVAGLVSPMVMGARHRYVRQNTSPCAPPRLPPRATASASASGARKHSRSRSETPAVNPDCRGQLEARQTEELGPVVISIKKSRSLDAENTIGTPSSSLNPDPDTQDVDSDDFRPRVKSESQVLSDKYKK